MSGKTIVIGACGQIGTELVLELRRRNGDEQIIAADIRETCPVTLENGPYIKLDVLDRESVRNYIIDNDIEQVYLLAALLSATAEKHPEFGWKLNMEGLFTILDLAKEGHLKKIFWPSSIAVFGPSTPKNNTPQVTVMEPTTVYGISKLSGERWCEYYFKQYGVDVRSLRYPGLISFGSLPGGGTTDYAVDIFYQAKLKGEYECFISEETYLPMMYMEDAIRATIELMEAPADNLTIRSSYNLGGISFTPKELTKIIQKTIPDFAISYKPDFRQKIADTWPESIDDSVAKRDWNWKESYRLEELVDVMLKNVNISLLESE